MTEEEEEEEEKEGRGRGDDNEKSEILVCQNVLVERQGMYGPIKIISKKIMKMKQILSKDGRF